MVPDAAPERIAPADEFIHSVRTEQLELSRELPPDVELEPYDSPQFGATRIRGVFPEYRGLVVRDQRDIEAVLPALSRYLGFVGEEGFVHAHTEDLGDRVQYLFFETIAEALVQDIGAISTFSVDKKSGAVTSMVVSAFLDFGIPRTSEITAEQAISLASKHRDAHQAGYHLKNSIARPEYRRVHDQLVLGWGLYLNRLEPSE